MDTQDTRHYFASESDEAIIFKKLYLLGFQKESFLEKWKYFESKGVDSLEDMQIRQSIREVMTFYNPITRQSYYNIPTWVYLYRKGSKFFRVRRIENNDIIIPPKETECWRDFWNPPEECITDYGRLNYPAESLLYTAVESPNIAIEEAKVKENESFVLITYEAIEDVYATIVGFHQDSNSLSETENEKTKLLTLFFKNIFTKEVSDQEKELYKISSNLIKECYTLNDGTQDGWVYPSIANKMGHNVCFNPISASNKLKVAGVELCKKENLHKFLIYYVLDNLNEESNFTYHLIGSEVQKQKYPHIKSN